MEHKALCENIILQTTDVYEENFCFLKTIDFNFPSATGTFNSPKKLYTRTERGGMSGVASTILLNQATIAYFTTGIIAKQFPEIADFNLTPEGFYAFANNTVITKCDADFKKIISNEMNLVFKIEVDSVVNKLESHGLIFFNGLFDVCEGSHVFKFSGAYCANKTERIKNAK